MRSDRLNFINRCVILTLGVALTVVASGHAKQTQTARITAPDTALIKKHVGYLASDKLEGRKTGTKGANEAAAYIAGQFHAYGLNCASPNMKCNHSGGKYNGYWAEFPFVAAVELAKNNSLSITHNGKAAAAQLQTEWMPVGYSSNGSINSSSQVLVGYGITASEQKYDDYAGVDAKGKIAVAFAGTPEGDNPHGQFARIADSRWKAVAAKDHGATALIIIARDEKFGDDRLSKLSYDQTSGEAGLPVIAVSRQLAIKLLGLTDATQLGELEKSAEKRAAATAKLSGAGLNLAVEITRRTVAAYNVIGAIEGNDPKLKDEYIIIGAHYDHLGHGGGSNSRAPESNEIHHGADDNASGVAGLIELARLFSAERKQLRRSLVFIAFSGEESGLIGSHHYVNHPLIPNAKTVAMINLDMVGRLKDNRLTIGGAGTASDFRKLIESSNNAIDPARRFTLQLSDDGFGPSDHSSFYIKQIPVLFFFTGTHEDYHKPSDTAEKINYDGEARILELIADLLRQIDRNDSRPSYTLAQSSGASGGRVGGFRIYLGTIPSYAESNDGLALDGVRDDSPASKAGLRAGDKIVKLAGREIKNVYDYTYSLGEMKADQEYQVEVLRGGERLNMKITPLARK